jgi:hypothetical protein
MVVRRGWWGVVRQRSQLFESITQRLHPLSYSIARIIIIIFVRFRDVAIEIPPTCVKMSFK